MTRVIILHGTKSTPDSNWFPWLESSLISNGMQVIRPALPTPNGQSLERWKVDFSAQCGSLSADRDILVGHSAGSTFALRLLETQPAMAAYLVAPFASPLGIAEFDLLNTSFLATPFQWEAISRNCRAIKLFHGDNDPYVPLAHAVELHRALAAPLVVVRSGEHLNADAGFMELPLLLAAILAGPV